MHLYKMRASATGFVAIVLSLSAALAQTAGTASFPLKVSVNRRHLVDAKDRPFLIVGDSPWSIISGVSKEQAERYLEDRRRKGFTVILANLIEHKFNGPVNREGEAPFTSAGDFGTPNEKYFAHADWVLRRAAGKGIVVFLFPMYLGVKGSDEGWYEEALLNGAFKCREYGRYLGRRYKDFPNIVWAMGGDRDPELAREAMDAVAAGIRQSMPDRLFTAHAASEHSAIDEYASSGLDLNATYTYGIVHRMLLRDYNRRPVMPFFLFESTYEGEHNSSPVQIRRQAYWAMLCGAAGQFFGNRPIWGFDSGWEAALDSEGSRSMSHLRSFFSSRPWHELIPDQTHEIVAGGLGEFRGLDYAAAARTADRRTVVTYIPTPRTVTVDTSRIAGDSIRSWWFDPRTGEVRPEAAAAGKGQRQFRTPGEGDWVLVVEDAAIIAPLPGGSRN